MGVGGKLDARFEQALALHQAGDLQEAQKRYRQILRKNPRHAHAVHLLGVIELQCGRAGEAVRQIDRAIAMNAANPAFHSNRANALQQLGEWEAAVSGYDAALKLKPDYAEAVFNRASALQKLGQYGEALAGFERAAGMAPRDADIVIGQAAVLQALGRHAEALAAVERALLLNPGSASAWCHRGNILHVLGEPEAAESSFGRALAFQPDLAVAHANRGHLHQEMGDFPAAINDYQRALAAGTTGSEFEYLRGAVLQARLSLCDWDGIEEDIGKLLQDVADGQLASAPFPLLTLTDDPGLQCRLASAWCAQRIRARPAAEFLPAPNPGERIRLGYFSADFHAHATAYLIAELFEAHDRQRFELIAFSYGPPVQDAMRNRLEAAFDQFLDVRELGDEGIARRARELGVDVAIDLKGYTRDQRVDIFAWRAAPVQVSYLGYPGTLGCPHIDYLVADSVLISPALRPHYSERIVYMPESYQCNDSQRPVAQATAAREDLGLPAGALVFAAFNTLFKLTPQVFHAWVRILEAVPGSVLWLLEGPAEASVNLRREAQRAGLDPSRLVFAPRVPLAEHLARHSAADLFLDTFPCNAHTTASDALWMGLPLVTCNGQSFASRVAASLLQAVGLSELITTGMDEYTALAIELAGDAPRRNRLRTTLADARHKAALFDATTCARHLEQACTRMVDLRRRGATPEDIYIES
tara:strand:+ start:4214 stop:6316 length:2103 start_codon:yes stop_codon:yes gene_type:complete